MRIYLVQHGLAEDKSKDESRPLSAQGLEDITRVAGFLSLFEKPQPHLIIHSDKLRAQQTAKMIGETWQVSQMQESQALAPNADPQLWVSRLKEMTEDVLLVGHLPHLSRLVSLLVQGDAEVKTVAFRHAGVLCLEKSEAGFHILWQINPTLFYGEDRT
ncbi:MAG: phosphohistidine phosphatase SixA [Mariprofundaceae bacterium]|nr:phosphohistidine phosphatase SixA [Mariprofundaceae bacterium]